MRLLASLTSLVCRPLLCRATRRLAPLAALVLTATAVPACATPEEEESASSNAAVSNIENTRVEYQTIGNCWLFATTAWVEALHLKATRETLDLSESYLTFWHWFEILVDTSDPDKALASINSGSNFARASKLIERYGLMREDDFVSGGGLAFWRGGDTNALRAVNGAMTDAESPLIRARASGDRVALRTALADLWDLSAETRKAIDATFGKDTKRTFETGNATAAATVVGPKALTVATYDKPTKGLVNVPLDDLLVGHSRAWLYWSADNAKTDVKARRAFETAVQRTLHEGLPAPLSFPLYWRALDNGGRFTAAGIEGKPNGGHMVLLYDYEVTNVPGFGTLPAGKPETRPDALAAALSLDARVSFFRVKNSWGLMPARPLETFGRLSPDTPRFGDYDIESGYLYAGGLWSFSAVLPDGI